MYLKSAQGSVGGHFRLEFSVREAVARIRKFPAEATLWQRGKEGEEESAVITLFCAPVLID
jgi:hypothetical protein